MNLHIRQARLDGQGRGRHRRHAGPRRDHRSSLSPIAAPRVGDLRTQQEEWRQGEDGARGQGREGASMSRPISPRSRMPKVVAAPTRSSGASMSSSMSRRSPIAARSRTPAPSCSTGCSRSMCARPSSSCRMPSSSCAAKRPGHDRQHHLDVGTWRADLHHRLLGLEGRAHHAHQERRLRRHAPRHPGQRPLHRLDGHARRRPHHEDLSRRRGRLAREAEAKLPFGRLLKPDEVARAVAYLASEESGLMTGSIIDFDQQVLGCADSAPQPPVARHLTDVFTGKDMRVAYSHSTATGPAEVRQVCW